MAFKEKSQVTEVRIVISVHKVILCLLLVAKMLFGF